MHTPPEDKVISKQDRPPGVKAQAIEIAVFLLLIIPSMIISLAVMKEGLLDFVTMAWGTIFRNLGLTSLILYFLWINGEPLEAIGWRFSRMRQEAAVGVLLFLPVFFSAGLLGAFLRETGLSAPAAPPASLLPGESAVERLLAVVLVTVVAVAEETIFRGYLMLRFRTITKSAKGALILSSIIFAVGHGYQGAAGIVAVGMLGLIFGLIYLWRGSLVAPMVMHFLQDFVGIMILSTVGGR